jgi:hypothetical protein
MSIFICQENVDFVPPIKVSAEFSWNVACKPCRRNLKYTKLLLRLLCVLFDVGSILIRLPVLCSYNIYCLWWSKPNQFRDALFRFTTFLTTHRITSMSNSPNIRDFGLPPLFWDITQSMDRLTHKFEIR